MAPCGSWGGGSVPNLCPLLAAGTTQRTLPRVPCATAVTPAVPLVTPSLESCQVLGLGCDGLTWFWGLVGGSWGWDRQYGLCPPAGFPGEGTLHWEAVGPLLVQKEKVPWYEGERTTPNITPWPQTHHLRCRSNL